MDKEFILEQMRLFAAKIGTQTIGKQAFHKATGIKETDWSGKFWARWSDATSEAGLSPGVMQPVYDKKFVAEKFISLIRELGGFPTAAEISLKAQLDKTFPRQNTFAKHLGALLKITPF